MAKYEPPALKNDEVRVKPYDKLSRGAKEEQDLYRRAKLKAAQEAADSGDSIGTKALDGVAIVLGASPFAPNDRSLQHTLRARENRERKRQDELDRAKDAANYEDVKRGGMRYGDMAPAKMDDVYPDRKSNKPIESFETEDDGSKFAKGGRVTGYRGYGKAKKV